MAGEGRDAVARLLRFGGKLVGLEERMKAEIVDIQLDSPSGFYLAGSLVQGAVLLSAPAPTRIASLKILLYGESLTKWVNKVSDVVYESKQFLLNQSQDLSGYVRHKAGGSNVLPEGVSGDHSIHFQFSLPPNIPSSIFNKDLGWVIYNLVASFSAESSGEVSTSKSLTVFSLVNLLHYPQLRDPIGKSDSVERISCFRSGGLVEATMTLGKSGFMAGETLTVHLEILNKTRKKRHPTLTLGQQLEFKAENQFYPGEFDKKELIYTIETLEIEGVVARATESYNGSVKMRIPRDILPSTLGSSLISVAYFLKFDIGIFELLLPICIGNALPSSARASHSPSPAPVRS